MKAQQMPTTAVEPKTPFGAGRSANILEFYTEEFRPQPSGVELFRQHIIEWFFAAKHLRRFEAMKLIDKPAEEDLASHRLVCSTLITFGEFASSFARQNNEELDLASIGLSVESIEAETRLLRDNFRMFHDFTISDKEAEDVLAQAFHEG